MNNKLRQQILNELKFLLNEQEEAEQGVFGGTFSEDLDDILEDINDAKIKEIAGFSYIDLTTMEDSTDEGELNLLVKSFKDVSDSSEIKAQDAKKAINTICRTNILLINSVGPTDTYFYVSCKQIPGGLNVPVSAKKIGVQGQEAIFPGIIKKIKQGSTSTPPSTPPTGNETGNFCADPKNEGKSVPDLMNFVCKGGQAVSTAPGTTPTPSSTPGPAPVQQTGKFFRCSNKEDVAVFQQWLGVKEDCLIGPNTMAKAIEKGTKFNLQDIQDPEKQKSFCNSLKANRASYEKAITDSGQTVKGKCLGSGSGGGGKGGQKGLSGTMYTSVEDAMAYVNVKEYACAPEGKKAIEEEIKKLGIKPKGSEGELKSISTQTIDGLIKQKCQIVAKESKNYYDNKKLNEAKQLFNKLLKNL